jgi:hypothetical protein
MKEETIDVDFLLTSCELNCLSVVGLCVSKIGGVAWCELFHGSCKNNGLFGFFSWKLAMVQLSMGGCW